MEEMMMMIMIIIIIIIDLGMSLMMTPWGRNG